VIGGLAAGSRRAVHILLEGLKGLVLSPGQTVACILSLAVAACLVALSATFGTVTVDFLERSGRHAQVLIYLKDRVPTTQVENLMRRIGDRVDVERVEYLSREQDRAMNESLLPRDLVDRLPPDSLPGQHGLEVTFRGTLRRADSITSLANFLRSLEEVEVVAEPPVGAARVRALATAVGAARVVMTILATLLLAGTLFFVVSILTRTMESRRQEMAILKLLGATDLFIKAPLYVQGMTQGIVGLVVGVQAARFLAAATDSYLVSNLGLSGAVPFDASAAMTLALTGGAALGALGALIASARRLP
jgi:cell division transport system permease protein